MVSGGGGLVAVCPYAVIVFLVLFHAVVDLFIYILATPL